ncbi:uncharacterized protein LOC142984236 isoform X1 [Anticarsia gemmatalis]|uniref:uncharacterized protein LOC142984236 isoform X1 n=1 Tax=Anticarsia gemmatalis TaxID=129554 RepID=UPI003F76ECAD
MAGISILIFNVFWMFATLANAKCLPEDPECAKLGASNSYPLFINGIEGLVRTSDPLSLDHIQGNLPSIKYKMDNAKFTGLKACTITTLEIGRAESTFKYHLECPKIELHTDYELIGNIADMHVEGEGKLHVLADDYVLMFDGKFIKVKGDDGREHAQIKNYFLDALPRGHVEFDFQNLFYGDKEKSDAVHNFINTQWKVMDKELRAPVLNPFMDLFINNLNDFLKVVPVEEIFPGLA